MLKQRLQDCAFQNWTAKLNDSSKADTYRGFKSLLNVERYLCIDMSLKLKQVLARFRCSSHKLQIEKGRHTGIDRSLRFCPLCQKDQISVVESEFHFLLECKSYQALRDKYVIDQWRNGKTLDQFNIIMSSAGDSAIIRLSKFVYSAFELRDNLL